MIGENSNFESSDQAHEFGKTNKLYALARRAVDIAIDSKMPKFLDVLELVSEYEAADRSASLDECVDELIRWQASKCAVVGAVAGFGGAANLPAAVFTMTGSFGPNWLIRARMVAAIARLYGKDVRSDRVRIAVMWCVLGDGARASAGGFAITASTSIVKNRIRDIPKTTMKSLNKPFGRRLITKAGAKSPVRLMSAVPIVGGLVGASIDAGACWATGQLAKTIFRPVVAEANAELHPEPANA